MEVASRKGETMEENKDLEQPLQEEMENTEAQAEEVAAEEVAAEASEAEGQTEEAAETETSDKAAEYLDRLQRLMAEFDNYRKRSEKEKSDAYDFAVSNTISELLPIIDNFERALKVETQDKALFAGVQMIYKQLMSTLENLKVTPIEALDQEFDPKLHNAIMHIDDEAYGENIIVEELQKGYLYKEKVIRHSMVKVAN